MVVNSIAPVRAFARRRKQERVFISRVRDVDFFGFIFDTRRWNDEPNSPFPKKKEAIERYHNQYHHRSGPLPFCNHHVHLPNGLALRYGVTASPRNESDRCVGYRLEWDFGRSM